MTDNSAEKSPDTKSKFLMLYITHEDYEANTRKFLTEGTTHKDELNKLMSVIVSTINCEDTSIREIYGEWNAGNYVIYGLEIDGFIGLPMVSNIPEYQLSFQETWYSARSGAYRPIPDDIEQWVINRMERDGITESELATLVQKWISDNMDILDKSGKFHQIGGA